MENQEVMPENKNKTDVTTMEKISGIIDKEISKNEIDEKIINENNIAIPSSTTESSVIKENENDKVFKKPLLVGKIGGFPRKLKCIPPKPHLHELKSCYNPDEISNCTEIIENDNDHDQYQELVEDKKLPTPSYIEPSWSGVPQTNEKDYYIEEMKNGSIVNTFNLMSKPYWVFGRLPQNDIPMLHNTTSRFHAVLQYRAISDENNPQGFYIYDLGSTHGTFVNKQKIKARVYERIRVGHMLKFGGSRRFFLFNGPEEDAEEESELSVTELKQKRKETLEKLQRDNEERIERLQREKEEREKLEEERGIDWGMGEDADEEADLKENPYSQITNEELYLDNPKKTLLGFFEREGLEIDYKIEELGKGRFLCKCKLPIEDEMGRPIQAEATHQGKKDDTITQCALEACRILDKHGLLRRAFQESRKRITKVWADCDYYDSDEDTFLDRTGTIETKRQKRMNAQKSNKAETYESLVEKEKEYSESIKRLEIKLREAREKIQPKKKETTDGEDSLDAYMKELQDSVPDKSIINKLKLELKELKEKYNSVIKLVNITKPTNVPPIISKVDTINKDNKKNVATVPKIKKEAECTDDHNSQIDEKQIHTKNSCIESCKDLTSDIYNKFKYISNQLPEDNQEMYKNLLQIVIDGKNKIIKDLNGFLKDLEIPKVEEVKTKIGLSVSIPRKYSEPQENNKNNIDNKNKDKNKRRIQQRQEKKEFEKQKGYQEDASKDDYNMWVPPKDQTGDGKTKLNEKFGY